MTASPNGTIFVKQWEQTDDHFSAALLAADGSVIWTYTPPVGAHVRDAIVADDNSAVLLVGDDSALTWNDRFSIFTVDAAGGVTNQSAWSGFFGNVEDGGFWLGNDGLYYVVTKLIHTQSSSGQFYLNRYNPALNTWTQRDRVATSWLFVGEVLPRAEDAVVIASDIPKAAYVGLDGVLDISWRPQDSSVYESAIWAGVTEQGDGVFLVRRARDYFCDDGRSTLERMNAIGRVWFTPVSCSESPGNLLVLRDGTSIVGSSTEGTNVYVFAPDGSLTYRSPVDPNIIWSGSGAAEDQGGVAVLVGIDQYACDDPDRKPVCVDLRIVEVAPATGTYYTTAVAAGFDVSVSSIAIANGTAWVSGRGSDSDFLWGVPLQIAEGSNWKDTYRLG